MAAIRRKRHQPILWRQVGGLALMLGAILFSFSIYGVYQPQVLADLGFSNLAANLGLFQGLLGALIEPLFGGLSDRILRLTGSRLPQITVGVTVAGLLFVVIALIFPAHTFLPLRWLLLGLMMLWLTAMIAVRGPIIALLRLFAPVEQLPIANGLIILVLGLVGALSPLLPQLLNRESFSLGFILGAVVLMLGAIALAASPPPPPIANVPTLPPNPLVRRSVLVRLLLTAAIGLGSGAIVNGFFLTAPAHLRHSLPGLESGSITSLLLLIAAIAANPMGWLTYRLGSAASLTLGLGGLTVLLSLTGWPWPYSLGIVLLMACGVVFGLVFINMAPFALAYVPPTQAGLSAGLYFGGSGAGAALVGWLGQFQAETITSGTIPLLSCGLTCGLLLAFMREISKPVYPYQPY